MVYPAGEELPKKDGTMGTCSWKTEVGMLRLLKEEFQEAYEKLEGDEDTREVPSPRDIWHILIFAKWRRKSQINVQMSGLCLSDPQ